MSSSLVTFLLKQFYSFCENSRFLTLSAYFNFQLLKLAVQKSSLGAEMETFQNSQKKNHLNYCSKYRPGSSEQTVKCLETSKFEVKPSQDSQAVPSALNFKAFKL